MSKEVKDEIVEKLALNLYDLMNKINGLKKTINQSKNDNITFTKETKDLLKQNDTKQKATPDILKKLIQGNNLFLTPNVIPFILKLCQKKFEDKGIESKNCYVLKEKPFSDNDKHNVKNLDNFVKKTLEKGKDFHLFYTDYNAHTILIVYNKNLESIFIFDSMGNKSKAHYDITKVLVEASETISICALMEQRQYDETNCIMFAINDHKKISENSELLKIIKEKSCMEKCFDRYYTLFEAPVELMGLKQSISDWLPDANTRGNELYKKDLTLINYWLLEKEKYGIKTPGKNKFDEPTNNRADYLKAKYEYKIIESDMFKNYTVGDFLDLVDKYETSNVIGDAVLFE